MKRIGDTVTVNGVDYEVIGREPLGDRALKDAKGTGRVAIVGLKRPRGRKTFWAYELASGRLEQGIRSL